MSPVKVKAIGMCDWSQTHTCYYAASVGKKRSTTKTTSLQPPVQQHFCSALFSVPRSLLFAATRQIEIHGIHACVCEFDDALLVMTLLEKDWGEELCSEKLNL